MPQGNAEILKKIEMLSSQLDSGGLLPPDVAKQFIIGAVKSAPFLRISRTVMMKKPEQKYPKLTITGRVLHAATESEGPPSADYVAPTTDEVSLTTKEMISVVPLSDTVLEDNIEEKKLWSTVERLMRDKIAADVQENFILGDTTSTDADLALFDGLIALVTSNTVDASAAAWSATVAESGMGAIDEEYYDKEEANLRWLGAAKTERKYRLSLTSRESGLGDILLENKKGSSPLGIPMVSIPGWPVDQLTGDLTTEILMNPKNFVGGWWRDIKIEYERSARNRKTYAVFTLRVGCELEEELATASVYDIDVS